jgi:hypothetical protein
VTPRELVSALGADANAADDLLGALGHDGTRSRPLAADALEAFRDDLHVVDMALEALSEDAWPIRAMIKRLAKRVMLVQQLVIAEAGVIEKGAA